MKQHVSIAPAMVKQRLRFLPWAFAMLLVAAPPLAAVDLDELTVVTLAGDGSWGVATAASQGLAIAAAIRDCRAMAGATNDCGAQFTTARGAWVVAKVCGDHKIIVTGATRDAADQAALAREVALKRLHSCTRALTIDPRGVVVPSQSTPTQQIGWRREER
jgi:hypothetical protein